METGAERRLRRYMLIHGGTPVGAAALHRYGQLASPGFSGKPLSPPHGVIGWLAIFCHLDGGQSRGNIIQQGD